MARPKRRISWNITTFNALNYIGGCEDRFVRVEDSGYRALAARYGSSSHSRRFRTKRAALRFLRSDVRCPRDAEWILMVLIWRGGRVLTGEYGTMMKKGV